METDIQIFKNSQFGDIRIATNEQGEPIFCLPDLCNVLGLTNPSSVKNRLDKEDVQLIDLHALNYTEGTGNSMTNFVNESGFYDVLLQSSSTKVKPFRKWVTSEVLPSIRKHGGYLTPQKIEEALLNPDTIIQLATNLKEERQKRLEAEKQISVLKPKADLMNKVMDCDQKIDIGQAAKILGLSFGRNTLFVRLREKGIFFKNRNEPKQEYIERGYFDLKEKWIDREHHDGFMVVKVLVTQKGLDFIAKLFEVVPDKKSMIKIS
jgi:prophage antirepressor-like protein